MSFSINCLEITATKEIVERNGNIYKNLLTAKEFSESGFKFPKRFFFNDYYKREPDEHENLIPNESEKRFDSDLFFGENINIQAIVGMNGCGKSSLLDLMYMAINNFCFMFERGRTLPNTTFLFYVENLYVKIYYSIQDEEYILHCDGEKVFLIIPHADGVDRKYDVSKRHKRIKTELQIKKIVEPFFYTIVSNYSMQSFISSNYLQKIKVFNKTTHVADELNKVCVDGTQKRKPSNVCFGSNTSWIDSIFHKNDGYVRSIVLNPFRDKGVIDMNREQQISKYRLISLLIRDSKEEWQGRVFQDYSIEAIKYELDENFIISKYPNCKCIEEVRDLFWGQDVNEEDDLYKIYSLIYNYYQSGAESSLCWDCACYYLTYKINKIVNSYNTYAKYRKKKGCRFSIYGKNKEKNFQKLIRQIEDDRSHVVSKMKQTVHFLKKEKDNKDSLLALGDDKRSEDENERFYLGKDDYGDFDLKFDYEKYCNFMGNTFDSLDEIIEQLPPPIFKYEVILKKEINGELANLHQLSSGELQMMYTLSTHAYHIRNLMSINDANRVKYQNINLVLDEVELCFHPEYQRLFVNKLIAMLNALQKDDYRFNVFIVTHSPFVLSDIPKSRILYLKEGASDYGEKINSFAGNIGEMLYDSFFLKSTMGEFAERKIKRLINIRNGIDPNTMMPLEKENARNLNKEADSTFKEIGDAVLKHLSK
ncbi:MAG: AAA family ATPase [Fibrobacter sp.]|uniref:AAA family ATPase n=1 Tax=Fibrobacter sp. TaxID=35828 RepID=UPI0025C5CBDA|nr:AAA family ATPase [Fibrobacter sp.]MBQ7080190.1 AAA family ATPase [Fibrobacter sp.]